MSKRNPEKRRVRSHFIESVSKMPRLSHWPDRTQPFEYKNSEVINWILSMPELPKWIFDKARTCGAIKFDPESETWIGVNHPLQ